MSREMSCVFQLVMWRLRLSTVLSTALRNGSHYLLKLRKKVCCSSSELHAGFLESAVCCTHNIVVFLSEDGTTTHDDIQCTYTCTYLVLENVTQAKYSKSGDFHRQKLSWLAWAMISKHHEMFLHPFSVNCSLLGKARSSTVYTVVHVNHTMTYTEFWYPKGSSHCGLLHK